MSDYSVNASAKSPAMLDRGSPSPTLVDTPLEEFPPAQPTIFAPTPGVPRLLTPAPNAPVPTRENSTIFSPLDNFPPDQSIAPSPPTTWSHPPIGPSSMGSSSPQKHAPAPLNNNLLLKRWVTRKALTTSKKTLSSWKPALLGTWTPLPNH